MRLMPILNLDVFKSVFGTVDSGEDLYFYYRLLQQEKDEKLSIPKVVMIIEQLYRSDANSAKGLGEKKESYKVLELLTEIPS